MSNEELMKPRYKVIADYPHNPYAVGDLLETSLQVPYPSFLCTETSYEEDGRNVSCGNWVQLTEIDKYPHLFRRLQWWEDRKPEDMPQYVKFYMPLPEKLRIRKVEQFRISDTGMCIANCEWFNYYLGDADEPATEAEYAYSLTSKPKDNEL